MSSLEKLFHCSYSWNVFDALVMIKIVHNRAWDTGGPRPPVGSAFPWAGGPELYKKAA